MGMTGPETPQQDLLLKQFERISHLDLPTPVLAIVLVVAWTVPSCASQGLAYGGADLAFTARATNNRK